MNNYRFFAALRMTKNKAEILRCAQNDILRRLVLSTEVSVSERSGEIFFTTNTRMGRFLDCARMRTARNDGEQALAATLG